MKGKWTCQIRYINCTYQPIPAHIPTQNLYTQPNWHPNPNPLGHQMANENARQTGIFFPEVNLKKSNELIKQTKGNLSILVRALTGHDFRNRHNNITDDTGDEICRFCKSEPESPAHIIIHCLSLLHLRAQTFNFYTADICQIWSAKTLVEFLSTPSILEMETGHD